MLRSCGLEEDASKISGYAFSGGGRGIQRVDVSLDGGATWDQAELGCDRMKGSQAWSWTQWTYMAPKGKLGQELAVKAIDESYNTQVGGSQPHSENSIS